MIYNNICKRPPMTETPARASLMPYEAAAALLVVLDPLPVLVDDPTPDLASAVVLQVYTPRMAAAFCCLSKVEQSIWLVDWMLKPPETRVRAGKRGLEFVS